MSKGLDGFIDEFNKLNEAKKSSIILEFSKAFQTKSNYSLSDLIMDIDKRFKTEFGKCIKDAKPFNVGYAIEESALNSAFKENADDYIAVLHRVSLLNNLYSTQLGRGKMPKVNDMTKHIMEMKKDIDIFHEDGDIVKMVEQLAEIKDTRFDKSWSFASKYLSFAFIARGKDAVPIADHYARKALSKIKIINRQGNIDNYGYYYERILSFKKELDNDIRFKDIDAFLWVVGRALS